MAKLLGRSKSFRLRKDSEHNYKVTDIMDPMPEPRGPSRGPLQQTPSLTSLQIATNAFDSSSPRPKTANETPSTRRNWSELTATGSPIEITTEEDTFLFPTPVPRKTLSPASSSGIKSAGMAYNEDLFNIGIAIGSPSQSSYFSPMSSGKLPPSQQDVVTPRTPPVRANTTREIRTGDMDGSRPKLSRWRSLGGLFAKRRAAGPLTPRQGSREALDLKKSDDARGDIAVYSTTNSTTSLSQSPKPMKKSRKSVKRRSPLHKQNPWDGAYIPSASPPPSETAPLLHVDIPEVRMERYSVMFSELLPNGPTRSSSLLARRQASGDRLKPPGGSLKTLDIPGASGKIVRRATLPSPGASPSYKLFPSKQQESQAKTELNRSDSTIHRPRPLRRSNTAPSSLPPPNPIGSTLSPAFEVDELDSDENGRTPTPSSHGSPTTPNHDDDFTYPKTRLSETSNRKSKGAEPMWEMITIGKSLEPGDVIDDDPDDGDWMTKSKPEVSIARSMSVTRANKEKLVVKPVGRGANSIRGRGNRRNVAPRTSIDGRRNEIKREILGDRTLSGKNEKLVEKKSMTPTMHFVEETGNRKSVWGLIETT